MLVPPGLTAQGYEIQFGTNHLGHFLLARLLVPILKKTAGLPGADVRVVVLSSVGMVFSSYGLGIRYSGLRSVGSAFTPSSLYRYGRSKLCNALFAREFQNRFRDLGITCVAVHPGIISTGLWSTSFGFARNWGVVGEWLKKASTMVPVFGFQSVETGVVGQLWAAIGKLGNGRGEVEGGGFYTPVGVKGQGTPACYDAYEAKRLWEWSEKAVAGYLS
jgi:retinol dehydrogenase-12